VSSKVICDQILSVFINNRSQAVRPPADSAWDGYFINGPMVSDDFISERASQQQEERQSY